MKACMMAAAALLAGAASAAGPEVCGVTVSQDEASRWITVGYALSNEAAIVTFEAYTNGVPLVDEALTTAYGDVWRRVEPGEGRQIRWQPRSVFPHRIVADGSVTVKVRAWSLDNPPDYMVVDLMMPSNRWWYATAGQVPYGVTGKYYKTGSLVMRRIHATGVRWQMGKLDNEQYGQSYDVQHTVMLTKDYYMGIYKVTGGQYTWVMNSKGDGVATPKQHACYDSVRGLAPTYDWPTTEDKVDPDKFIGKLRARTGIDTFDLPTEAQWEFAIRAGTTDSLCGAATIGEIAWLNDSSVDWTAHGASGSMGIQVVGLLKPNAWGIYDPLGNGFECCLDYSSKGDDYAKKGELKVDPVGPVSNASGYRVVRSGSYAHSLSQSCSRPAYRNIDTVSSWSSEYTTFRVICGASFR